MGDNKKSFGALRTIILIVALGVLVYSGYRLFLIYRGYKQSSDEYKGLAGSFTRAWRGGEGGGEAGALGEGGLPGSLSGVSWDDALSGAENPEDPAQFHGGPDAVRDEWHDGRYENADPPLEVDWDELAAINPEIVGWIYVDGLPHISYPICRAGDNDYYLHHTFRKEYLFAGSIFEDYHNAPDFSDPNSVVYGHNMRDGSMFNTLKQMNSQEAYEANPYFWILTPKGNYRYHIYSIMTAGISSEVYVLYHNNGPEFLEWEKRMQAASNVRNDVKLLESDKTVVLSTCTSDSSVRWVVIGKCVSSERPAKPTPIPTPTPTPEPTPEPQEDFVMEEELYDGEYIDEYYEYYEDDAEYYYDETYD